jgi:hypothetical protein
MRTSVDQVGHAGIRLHAYKVDHAWKSEARIGLLLQEDGSFGEEGR